VPTGVLFLVLPESRVAAVKETIRELVVPEKRQFVEILSDAAAYDVSTDIGRKVTQNLIKKISLYPQCKDNKLIIGNETRCSIADLTGWWRTHEFGDPDVLKMKPAPLDRAVKEHLEKVGWHWRVHAEAEIAKFDGPCSKLQSWLQQFGELGCTDIGRKIAARLRVVRTGVLAQNTFIMRATDSFGQRQAHCFVRDDDAGGSWLEMQAVLVHAFPRGAVFGVNWDKEADRLLFPDASVDEFVVYEDGLWSGMEAARRIRAIRAQPPSVPVTFRFAIVTDFGLMVARHAIRSLNLSGRVTIDTSTSDLISFLRCDVPEALRYGLGMSTEDYFLALHRHVRPWAFSVGEDWTADDIQLCGILGEQLVHRWLSRCSTGSPPTERVKRFALGAGGFASTVLFSRSVPKVCLPLLWLHGSVELNGKQLDWRPLFFDARRVSDGSLLLSATRKAPT
jgi:hypothetical protein